METTMKVCEKRETREEARLLAKILSESNPDNELYLIQATENGQVVYYVDSNGFIRSSEILLEIWLNGKKVKN